MSEPSLITRATSPGCAEEYPTAGFWPATNAAWLAETLDSRIAAGRRRLLRLAQLRGIEPDVADDVVQDTLLIAWQHLEALRRPERFDAWLDAICRNVCRVYARAAQQAKSRRAASSEVALPRFSGGSLMENEIPDFDQLDPDALLERQDLQALLDRAIGLLAPTMRDIVELCYLAELPRQEVAHRLGLTINALEVRLHRARKQLRRVLADELYAEAEAYGFPHDQVETTDSWHATPIWCPLCGERRLLGRYTVHQGGGAGFFLSCPNCLSEIANAPLDEMPALAQVFRGVHAYKPALSRLMTWAATYVAVGSNPPQRICCKCGGIVQFRAMPYDERPASGDLGDSTALFVCCERCDLIWDVSATCIALAQPAGQQFWRRHPRMRRAPTRSLEYSGRPALLVTFSSENEQASISTVLASDTFETLAVSLR